MAKQLIVPHVEVRFDREKGQVLVNHNVMGGWESAVELLEEGLKFARAKAKEGKVLIPGADLIPFL